MKALDLSMVANLHYQLNGLKKLSIKEEKA